MSPWTRYLGVGALVLLAVLGAFFLRDALGIEWSASSVRELVASAGSLGPVLFIGVVAFRFLVMIPGPILLAAAGLCFGAPLGSVYGAIGLTLAGLVNYYLVHWVGAEGLRERLPRRFQGAVALGRSRAGAAALTLVSGYPAGPIPAVQIGAAVTGMALGTFTLAVGAGSLVRAGTYSYFGSALAEGEGLLLASAVLVAAFAIPLAIPRTRAWLRQAFRATES